MKKKHDNTGVGALEAADRSRDWTAGMMAYDRVLGALSAVTSKHASKPDSDLSSDESDEETEKPVLSKKVNLR